MQQRDIVHLMAMYIHFSKTKLCTLHLQTLGISIFDNTTVERKKFNLAVKNILVPYGSCLARVSEVLISHDSHLRDMATGLKDIKSSSSASCKCGILFC